MNFLTQRLQDATGHQLDVINLLEFLYSLPLCSSQTSAVRLKNFQTKWEHTSYVKGLSLAYIKGSWKPCAGKTFEISSQRVWEQYVSHNYKITISSSLIISKSGSLRKPLTFKEMIQDQFWRDVYDCFGHKVVSFILDKSLIIFEIEENFYLVVASDAGLLSKNLSKPIALSSRRTGGRPTLPTSNSFNPYVNDHIIQPKTRPCVKRKQINSEKESLNLGQSSVKKSKLLEIPPESGVLVPISSQAIFPAAANIIVNTVKSLEIDFDKDTGIIRWFKPSQNILKFIVEERERLKRLSGAKFQPHADVDGLIQLHFVGIKKDAEFSKISRNNLHVVIKQFCTVNFNNIRVRSEWKGLFMNEPEPHSPDRKYNANVYFISETFSLKNNIRLKVKKRSRKKKKNYCKEIEVFQSSSEPEGPKITISEGQTGIAGQSFILAPSYNLNSGLIDTFMPFNPLIMLPVLPALYNRSSWSRWPKNHIVTMASSMSLDEGAQLLMKDILSTDVGSTRLDNFVDRVRDSSMLSKFKTILEFFIKYHKRVKDIHKIVKKSLSFWILKKQEKILRREQRKVQRQEWRLAHPRKTTKSKIEHCPNKSQEVIDLTMNSPTTDTTCSPDLPALGETFLFSASSAHHSSLLDPKLGSTPISQEKFKHVTYAKLKEAIPPTCILLMLRHIMHLSGLDKALGWRKNVVRFYQFLRKSIILAGTKSSLQLGQLMAEMDPNSCEWLTSVKNDALKLGVLSKVAKWIFTNYILTILRSSFYITEINMSRAHCCFFLRDSWKGISESVRHRLVQSGTLKHAGAIYNNPSNVGSGLSGINSRLRLLPKKNNDLRPIISLRRDAKWAEKNSKLIMDHLVRAKTPHRDRDTNFLRSRWLKFLTEWQNMGKPKLFFVKADIKNAYPSVKVKKLTSMLDNVSKELGTLDKKEFKVVGASRTVYRSTISNWRDSNSWNASICTRPCIVINCEKQSTQLTVRDIFHKCFPFTKDNILRIGRHKYSFERGLPQGYVLSEGLCNLYYGDMDCKYLSGFLNNKGEFINTSVDDYLYVTSDPKRAALFLKKLENGFSDYNCVFNPSKIWSNLFPTVGADPPLSQECEWVTCCGWRFCLTCGHMMRDFSLYAGQDMASTVTFIPRNATTPENFLITRMKCMLPGRLHHFMLDPAINCKERIILNIWEAGLIFSFRFYAICRVMYPSLAYLKNPLKAKQSIYAIIVCTRSLARVIIRAFQTTYPAKPTFSKCGSKDNQVCKCIHSYHSTSENLTNSKSQKPPTFARQKMIDNEPLIECEILYILYHAFLLKLKKHSSVFGAEVIPRVHKIRGFHASLMSAEKCNALNNLLGSAMPQQFQDIKI